MYLAQTMHYQHVKKKRKGNLNELLEFVILRKQKVLVYEWQDNFFKKVFQRFSREKFQ